MAGHFLYKTIDKELFDSLGIEFKRSFVACLRNGKKQPLEEKQLAKSDDPLEKMLEDPTSYWDHRSEGVLVDMSVSIEHPSMLFGRSGVAFSDATLGFGIEWLAKESKIRDYVFLGYIKNTKSSISFSKSNVFVKDFTSDVTFRVVFFISEPGTPAQGLFFGNQKGLVLGKVDRLKIVVKGKGSVFPLNIVSRPNEALWKVTVDFEDPYSDPFTDDNVRISFNKDNPAFPFINEDDKENYNPEFFKEILGASFAALLLEIRHNYEKDKFDLNRESYPGSIHTAIKYFAHSLDIDVNGSPAEVAKSAISYIEKEYK
ncbi:MAG: hypothetical protein SPL80_07100 [Bacilli bacterium]|nr:hypothetical protein [Bacilli bacterium]